MRCVLFVVLISVLPAFAQRGGMHGGGGMRGGGFSRGTGSSGMRFGGGGGFRNFRGGFAHQPVFRNNFGFGRSRLAIYPYWPSFYSGFGYYDSYPSYSYAPYSSYYAPYSGYAYSGPLVTIVSDSSYGNAAPPPPPEPVVQEYVARPPEEPVYEPPLYLIAFRDGTIRAALTYWTEGTALHYVSMEHEQKQAPLASVDRDLSERLNRERHVRFQLPR